MGISTVTFQQTAINQIEALDTAISQTQNELSSGTKLPNAAANPVGMTQVNDLNAQLSASQQYVTNGNSATSNLQLEESALTNATNLLQSAQSLATEANNGSLSSSDLQDIATQLEQQLGQLTDIANSTDTNGQYLFSGQASGTQPFAQSGNSVAYSGAATVNQIEIGANQFISAGDTGSSVFMNVPAGNGTFTTSAGSTNTGSASIDPGTVTDPATWASDSGTYTITFTSPTQYQIIDTTTGNPIQLGTDGSGNPVYTANYTSGDAISFDGIQATISGTPDTGDQFTVAPAGKTSAFSTLSNLVATLNSTSLTAAQRTTQIEGALQQLDNAVNQLNNVQASVGARLNAVTTAQSGASSQQTTLQTSISQLSDTDYAAATTQLSTEEIALQAAEQSYASIAKLSLFNYL
jgi:flagellar hook-associated protein 3 FlgL